MREPTGMKAMKFVLEKVTDSGVRLGKMVWWTGNKRSIIETPLCLPLTRGGAIPHLVQSGYHEISHRPYELPGTPVLKEYKHGIHKFLNMKDQLLYLSIQDPHCPPRPGYNEDKNVSVWTNGGRMKVSVDDYMNFVRVSRPNVFECLCDSVSSQNNKVKRVRKSVDRTLRFLDQTLSIKHDHQELEECGVLGAVVGGDIIEERIRSATETAKRPVDGFVLEGFDLEHSRDCYQSILLATTAVLPESRPRYIHGVCFLDDVFTAAESGVDVFDGVSVLAVTENGFGLTFPNNYTSPSSSSSSPSSSSSSSSSECNLLEENSLTKEIEPCFHIDLNNEKYAMEFAPIVRGCDCYCCAHHTRAYIHHLLSTKEMLARTLLMMHNLTHQMKFFANLRKVLKSSSNFEYLNFKSSCLTTLPN